MKNSILLLAFLFLLSGCSTEYSAIYQSVSAASKWDVSERILIDDSKHELPLFKVVDNKLYLLIQLTQVEWFFRSVVNYPSWDKPEVNRIVQEHADIKSLIPVDWNNWLPKGFGEECKTK